MAHRKKLASLTHHSYIPVKVQVQIKHESVYEYDNWVIGPGNSRGRMYDVQKKHYVERVSQCAMGAAPGKGGACFSAAHIDW